MSRVSCQRKFRSSKKKKRAKIQWVSLKSFKEEILCPQTIWYRDGHQERWCHQSRSRSCKNVYITKSGMEETWTQYSSFTLPTSKASMFLALPGLHRTSSVPNKSSQCVVMHCRIFLWVLKSKPSIGTVWWPAGQLLAHTPVHSSIFLPAIGR